MLLINNRYNLFDRPGHAHRPRFLTGPSSAPTPSPPTLRHHSEALLYIWTDP
jgi:hypothetical protein